MTVDPEWALKAGYDMSESADVQTVYLTPMDMDGEHILDMIRDFVKTGEVGLVILDSIPYLVGQQVYEESFEKKEMGGIAKLLTTFVSRIASLLVKYQCTFIGINQLRDNIGGYGPAQITPGGKAWKFGCSLRLMVKRGEFLDEEGNTLTSNAVVSKVKKIFKQKKVGHLGTLDPLGCGVLPITLGNATKLFDFYLNKTKKYRTIFRFGNKEGL